MIDPIMLALSRKTKGIPKIDLSGKMITMDGENLTILDQSIIDVLDITCSPLQVSFAFQFEGGEQQYASAIFSYSLSNGLKMYQFTIGPLLFTLSESNGSPWIFYGTINTA